MSEDKLEPAQRIRLEALNQAVQVTIASGMGKKIFGAMATGDAPGPATSAEVLIETASRLERWIAGEAPAAGYGWLTSAALVDTIHHELERIERQPVAVALAETVALAIARRANEARPS